MSQIDIHQAKTHLSRLLERAGGGEEIIIAKAGKPLARLVPYAAKTKIRRRPGQLRGKLHIKDNFDQTLRKKFSPRSKIIV